ncbi:MAG: LD-carboxypeptidase [Deltaproteobacteria bacterium]|nr:LD-carboxypeptidase [Deltaproteobacteria bacterium]
MTALPLLFPGARVAVVAPAGRFVVEQLRAGCDMLREQGYQVVPAPNLWATDRYHAGTLAERQADLDWALAARDIDAVWLARGGYGCVQLLRGLRPDQHQPKPLLGFSDGTALMAALDRLDWLRDGGALLHAPVVHTLAPAAEEGSLQPVLADGPSRRHLWQLLQSGQTGPLATVGASAASHVVRARGPVVGGNLTVLASLCGTPWQLQARGRIVLLEDVAEAPYRLDRSLTQLIESGCLDGALAVGLGEFSGCSATDADGQTYQGTDVLRERLASLGLPVVGDLPFGHGCRNLAWPWGAAGVLTENGLKFS